MMPQGSDDTTVPSAIYSPVQGISRNIFIGLSVLVIALVVAAAFGGGFLGSRSSAPVTSPTPILAISPTSFTFTTITLKNGQGLPIAQPVTIPVAQLPLTITGTYSSQGSGHVWVLVEDAFGQYYLQITPVQFATGGLGQWRATGVNTNVGTTQIDFVSVTSLGQSIFSFMAQAKAYGAFPQLPDGSQIIQTISIHVTH